VRYPDVACPKISNSLWMWLVQKLAIEPVKLQFLISVGEASRGDSQFDEPKLMSHTWMGGGEP
jgi:hypothetical protein